MAIQKRKFRTVSIPSPLFGRIKIFIEDTGFNSVSDFVTFVLREVMTSKKMMNKKWLSKKDKEKIIARLRDLGYIK